MERSLTGYLCAFECSALPSNEPYNGMKDVRTQVMGACSNVLPEPQSRDRPGRVISLLPGDHSRKFVL